MVKLVRKRACLKLLSLICFYGAAVGPAISATESHDTDSAIIRAQAGEYCKAFASGDVDALASMWSEDAVFTDQSGVRYCGRNAISGQMSSFFKKYGKQQLVLQIDSLEFPADNLAIENGTSHVGSKESPAGYATYTAVHVKRDGKWVMVNVSESPKVHISTLNQSSINDLSWLIGAWKVEGPRGELLIKADWVAGKKVIRFEFEVQTKDGEKSTQTQFVYFDPLFKRIRSWQYDWEGGYGESRWFKSGDDWTAMSYSVQSDGSAGSAKYLLKKIDANTFSWQSTSRRILGRNMPDTAVLTAKRIGG